MSLLWGHFSKACSLGFQPQICVTQAFERKLIKTLFVFDTLGSLHKVIEEGSALARHQDQEGHGGVPYLPLTLALLLLFSSTVLKCVSSTHYLVGVSSEDGKKEDVPYNPILWQSLKRSTEKMRKAFQAERFLYNLVTLEDRVRDPIQLYMYVNPRGECIFCSWIKTATLSEPIVDKKQELVAWPGSTLVTESVII